MSKRPGSATEANHPPKRARKPAGFRVARSTSVLQQAPGPSSSSNSTLFITVNKRRGNLKEGQTRVFSNTPEPPAHSDLPEPAVDIRHDDTLPLDEESPPVVESPDSKPKRKRYTKNVDQLTEWLKFRATFLDEILRHDGLGNFLGHIQCSGCGKVPGVIRCKDCSSGGMLKCPECAVAFHQSLPLHRVERWNGAFFDRESLQNLGLCYQLGHSGDSCPLPKPGPKTFTVFDTSGPHLIAINYCNCQVQPLPNYTQLLREKWFPATLTRPQTVFTFDCLETFHELTLQGKTNLYDYYNTLLRRFDNAGISNSINRYSEIHRVFRMWRNLMALKRAGRGHELGGIDATSKGELMVECPACPHPGRNLPEDWEKAGPLLFLYTLYVAVDGNFKLKGKQRNLSDVELMPGLGAYVEEVPYQTHIATHVKQPEINTCESQHDALVRAATRSSPGYAVSGAVVVICSRHCLIRRNGAGDLQKGEKYCNVDFVIFSALVGIALLRIVLTYDIACQWSKNFRKRMEEFPPEMRIPDKTQVDVAIPGWHINGHGITCRNNFNLSYMEGVGRTVGEDVETIWAGTNPLAPSVREMGPAARHDTLNDHWNGWNFRKIVGFRKLFNKRFHEASEMAKKQSEVFKQLSATFSPETVANWEAMVVAWNANPKAPNPYAESESRITLQDVRLELAREEAARAALGTLPRHKISMATFLLTGFELEDSQYLLRREAAQQKGLRTSKQLADLQEKRNGLLRLIQNWREVQLAYTPHVASLISQIQSLPDADSDLLLLPRETLPAPSSLPPEILAENIPLFLPSALPPQIRCLPELQEIYQLERRLREPQANDALAVIQRQRRIIQGLWQFKRLNASGAGNRPNTRMVMLYEHFDSKIKRAAQEYSVAWHALCILDPNGAWSLRLRELKDQDIRGPGKDVDDTSSNSRYEPSWIWLVPHVSDVDQEDEFNESMRVEWAKARARMMRWKEELLLVQEEMRRVIEYLRWRKGWWQERSSLRTHNDGSISSGISGYANKQAAICSRIAEQCACYWLPHLKIKGITPSWASHYESLLDVSPVSVNEEVSNGSEVDEDYDVIDSDDEEELAWLGALL